MGDAAEALEGWVIQSWRKDGAVLPAFPIVASRLVDTLEQHDVEMEHVEEVITQDGAITAQVIRAANSAVYGGAAPIEGIRQAVVRLGFRETANVAMAAACRSLFAVEERAELEVFPDVWARLWESSLVGAYGARLVATELKLGDPGHVFLAAMLRDVGSLVILKLVASGLVHGRLHRTPAEAELGCVFRSLHPRLGASYLRRFQLPDYVIEAVEKHHSASLPFAHDTVGVHIVRCADGLCERLAIPPFSTGDPGPAGAESAELLGLDDERLDYLALQFEGVREQLRDLM